MTQTSATDNKAYSRKRFDVDFGRLRRAVRGAVRDDEMSRALYASSASIVEVWPSCIVEVKDAEDVSRALAFARDHNIPVTCRGAGSGVAGQSLGEGIILDFAVHMHSLLEVRPSEGWARVQPGLVKDDFDAELKTYGMFWPPDPSSSPWCTVGAMVANNSGGAKSIRYGTAKDYLLELDVMLVSGERVKLRPLPVNGEEIEFPADASAAEKRLAQGALKLARENASLIAAGKPQSPRNSAGYNLFELCQPDSQGKQVLDMPRLFSGSEGTLGVLLEARIRVLNLPRYQAGVELYFDSNQAMAEGIVRLLPTGPTKLEVLDRSFIDVAAKTDPTLAAGLPERLRSMLIVEYWTDAEDQARERVDAAVAAVKDGKDAPAFAAKPAYNPADLERAWTVRKIASPILSRVKGDLKPTRWIEDCAVPPWKLAQFIEGFKAICERHGFAAALFGHGGEGNLHVNPFVNVKDPTHRERMRRAADEVHQLAYGLKGTHSGEHGEGIMRSPAIKTMYGDLYPVFVAVKELFDPGYLLNPLSKIGPRQEGRTITDFLRMGEDYRRAGTGTGFDRPEILDELEKCHGCGKCRQYCPLMRVGKEEKYSARAKANLMRAVVAGRLDASFLVDAEFKANMDLCISCEQCLTDCPTQVDIPGIAMAFREQYLDRKGRGGVVADLMGKPDKIGKAGRLGGGLTNMLLKNRFLRGVAQATTGLDERRKLPEVRKSHGVARLRMLEVSARARALLPREAVVFSGCFAEYYDPDGEKNTLLEILRALGVRVDAPSLHCCGISKITQGDSRGARNDLAENVDKLIGPVRRGARIIFSAPSCLLAARREWPRVAGGTAAAEVAAACVDAHALLRDVFNDPEMAAQLKPLTRKVAWHTPCHSKVMGVADAARGLLDLLDGRATVNLDAGCCGLSGTFGLKTDNFDMSMKIGLPLFNRINRARPDVVSTSCGVCQTQIRQGVTTGENGDVADGAPEIAHPLRLLYDALPKA